MTTEILMPALSPTMTEGKLAKWLKNKGDDGQGRRRDRRDRDRQGDHGGRGGRRRQAGARSWCRQAPRREGQHADRAAAAARTRTPARCAGRASRRPQPPRRPSRAAPAQPQPRHRPRRSRRRRVGAEPDDQRRHPDHDRARSPARRHGRGDAPRSDRLPDGRGSRRVPGRLQGQPGPAGGIRRQARHRHADHRAWLRRARRRRGLRRPAGPSSSS